MNLVLASFKEGKENLETIGGVLPVPDLGVPALVLRPLSLAHLSPRLHSVPVGDTACRVPRAQSGWPGLHGR